MKNPYSNDGIEITRKPIQDGVFMPFTPEQYYALQAEYELIKNKTSKQSAMQRRKISEAFHKMNVWLIENDEEALVDISAEIK